MAGGFLAVAAGTTSSSITEGDWVRLSTTIYDANGVLIETTNRTLAQEALLDGNQFVAPNLTSERYRPQLRQLTFDGPFGEAKRYLAGASAGQRVETPVLSDLAGEIPRISFSQDLGPLTTHMQIDRAYWLSADKKDVASQNFGDIANLSTGSTFLYLGSLPARVVSAQEQTLHVEIEPMPGARIFVPNLGFNVTIETVAGALWLHPDLELGDSFDAYDCDQLPFGITAGHWRIIESTDQDLTAEAVLSEKQAILFQSDLRVVFDVLEIRRATLPERLDFHRTQWFS